MIKIKFFPNKNGFHNLWGMLGDVAKDVNTFLEVHGARGTNGINLGPQGVYITYEDGVFHSSVQKDILLSKLMKNKSEFLTQEISYLSLANKHKESKERLEEIAQEDAEYAASLKEDGTRYKELKEKREGLEEEKNYLTNTVTNCEQQILVTKADMDRIEYENAFIEKLLARVERESY